jgi:large subunit ribosomal protein L21
MYAVIEDSGSQRRIREGDLVLIDLLEGGEAQPGHQVQFDKVLLVGHEGDAGAAIGRPYVSGATVSGEVVEPVVMGEKLVIQKFRPKRTFRKRTGHRQRYTSVRITAING